MVDDKLAIVFRGVAAVVGALKEDGKHESLSGVPVDEQREVYEIVKDLYRRFGEEPPNIDRLEDDTRAVGDVDPTNFPAAGDDLKVSLRNSNFDVFDPAYAEKLKTDYPEIWRAGGNIEGNNQYRRLKPVVDRGGVVETETEEMAVRKREAWSARHFDDFRLAGVVAQIKWFTVGSRGEKYMKDLVNEEKAKYEKHRGNPETRALELPSEWPSAGMFSGLRTLNLNRLAGSVSRYTRTVTPFYNEAERELTAFVNAHYNEQTFDSDDSFRFATEIGRVLDKLALNWSIGTPGLYRDAAKIGRDGAVQWTGAQVSADWETYSDLYHEQAMQFLVQPGGLISDLKTRLTAIFADSIRTKTGTVEVRDDHDDDLLFVPGPKPATLDEVQTSVAAAFAANRFRVQNWSGRLVDVGNTVLVDGMLENGTAPVDGDVVRARWVAEWVNVGDVRMCETCAVLGQGDPNRADGYWNLAALPTRPGADTECRANCRCVLVLWTNDEVNDGTAVKLNDVSAR
jgi:hypothetical protein